MQVTLLDYAIDSQDRLALVLLGSEVTSDNWDNNGPRQW